MWYHPPAMTTKSCVPRTDKRKAKPKPGARLGGMTDSSTDRVTEPEARAAYIAMNGRRSILAVRKRFVKERKKTPSLRTFQTWCGKHRWVALALEHDDKVVAATTAKIAKAAVAHAVSRADQFDLVATESLKMAIAGLDNIDDKTLKVPDIRSLMEVSERATKMFELLEGRATDRTDGMTRQKMDTLMKEMEDEIDERLARVKKARTVH